ncbi:helix-turn-helix domain-containing protein [Streptomyces anulatus]|uniref:helix-turn-helix domain-containing protein n=1 Tax=Streptomyces anulatus TaxID=1892 RepID=UPI00364C59D3
MLEALGLSDDEAEIYVALVRSGPSRADSLPALPEQRMSAALQGLAQKGLLTRSAGPGSRFIASPPDIAGEVLLLRRMQELHLARAAMGRLTDEYRSGPKDGRGRASVEFTDSAAVTQRAEQMQRGARTEVLIFDMPPYASPSEEGTAPNNRAELERLASGVRYRTVYDRQAIEQPGGLDRIRWYIDAGEEARAVPQLPLKMLIVDGKLGIVPALPADPDRSEGSALIHPSPLLDGLIGLFELTWSSALPLDVMGEGEAGGGELDDTEAWLLTLLLSGLTDEVIARQMGVGRRTVLRRARNLMDRAGVVTRMQLGWHAAQRGWIGSGRTGWARGASDT